MSFLSKYWFILLFSFGVIFIALSPYLIGGLVVRGDNSDMALPYLTFLKDAFMKGESPFWNPYNAAGFPSFVTNSYPFFPSHILLFLFSPLLVNNISWYVVLGLALFFAILFMKALGLSPHASIIGGASFLISQIVYENNALTAVAVFVQAFFFWGIAKLVLAESSKQRLLYGFLSGLALGLGWLSGGASYQFVTYTIIGGFAFILFFAWQQKKKIWFTVRQFILVCMAGAIIGLPQLIPAFSVSQFSLRADTFSLEEAGASPITLSDLLLFINPFFPRSSETFLYMGLIPLALLIVSFFFRSPYLKFFRILFLVALAVGFYKSPLLLLIQKIPILQSFRYSSRYMIIGSFAGAVLAGVGFDKLILWLKKKLEVVEKPFFRFILLGLVLLTALDFLLAFRGKFSEVSVPSSLVVNSEEANSLKKIAGDGRILFFLPDDSLSFFYWGLSEGYTRPSDIRSVTLFDILTLKPNTNLLYGLENLEYLDSLLPKYTGRFLSLLGGRQLGEFGEHKLHQYNTYEDYKIGLLRERKGLLDFFGINYLVSSFILEDQGLGVSFVDTIPIREFIVSDQTFVLAVNRNRDAKPLAYFSPISSFVSEQEDAYQRFKSNNFQGIFVECGQCIQQIAEDDGEVRIVSKENGQVRVMTKSSGERFMVFSQNFLPGWQAVIDNKETDIYRVNSVFMGIFIPAGSHEIAFEFRYSNFYKNFFTK
jgi:hypothetical protein